MEELEALITHIVKNICRKPEEVELHSEQDAVGWNINIKVAREDIPGCIGYQGLTADALRRIANIYVKTHELDQKVYVRVDAPPLPKNHFYE